MSEKIKVNSSNLEFVEYIADKKELRIWFLNDKNTMYTFFDIEQKIYDGLIKAPSKGEFFRDYIKGHNFKKIGVDLTKGSDKTLIEVKCPYCIQKFNVDVSKLVN